MASATVDHRLQHRDNRLHLESIPLVDLRLLSQPELLSLSFCSTSPSPSNAETEIFTPKIDRSVFNESAGSRKQTFSRLRLAAPRNYLHHHHSSPSSTSFASLPRRLNPEPLDEESSGILPLLKSLFNIDDSLTANTNGNEPDDDKDLVPVQIEYPTGNSVLQDIPVSIVSCSGSKRKRGRPRKDEKVNWLIESESLAAEEQKDKAVFDRVNKTSNAGEISSCSEKKRTRGRPRRDESQSKVIESEEKKVESEIEKVASGSIEAILGIEEELRRRTEGMSKEADLLEYLGGLEGEWASKSLKKRIVYADGFGEVLPKGWKLMLFVKRRAGHACPDGQQFVSCKEVSSYLLSFGGLKDSSQSTSSQTGCGIGSGVKPTSGNLPITCVSSQHKKKAPLLGRPMEVQRAETIKCHKCPMTFNQQDDFIGHLLSSHQGTTKSSGQSSQTNEEVIIKNGKYECQFCNELFEERSCYSSHLEIHMKNNMKKDDGSVGASTTQNSIRRFNPPNNNEMRPDFPRSRANENAVGGRDTPADSHECNLLSRDKEDIKVNRIEKTLVDENFEKQNKCGLTNSKGVVTETAAVEFNVCLSSEKLLFAASAKDEKADVALNSIEEKKTEMASSTSLHAANAEKNSDEKIEDRHFGSFMKKMEADFKDTFTGDDPKASCTNARTRPNDVMIDIEQKNCSKGCSVIFSSNEGGNLVDHVKGTSAIIDSAQDRGYRCSLTSYKDEQARVITDKLTVASSDTLYDPESFVLSESGNNVSTIGFQSDHCIKKPPQQDSKSALPTLHGRDQNCFTNNSAFKLSSQRVERPELAEVEKFSGLMQDVHSHSRGFDPNILGSVRQARTNDYSLVSSPYKKTFTNTLEERKQVKGSESSAYEQYANQQNSYNATSMNNFSFSTSGERKHKVQSSFNDNAHARVGTFDLTGTGLQSYSPLFSGNGERFAGKTYVPGISGGTVYEPKQNIAGKTHVPGISGGTVYEPKQNIAGKTHVPGISGGTIYEPKQNIAGNTNVPGISGGTVHEPKQNKGSFEDFFCLSGSEQTQVTNNLNMIYAGTAQGEPRLGDFENARNNEVIIGFGNHAQRPEDSMTGFTWKSDELLQSSGYYPTFDLMSHKGESEMYNISGKCGSVSGFEELRTDSIGHMEYDFLTAQPSSRSGGSKVSSNDSEMAVRSDSSIWFGKEALPLLPKVAGRHQIAAENRWKADESGSWFIGLPSGNLE
ncbi:Zinc finger, C2H2-like protein [Corchorus olitorius]|uniref:Zinc finger, C2H2-like protein n=1 Tax=Corchorus olitorius TaxID=93759 RepID=A0A1R3JHP5_9ROSI|nr:Zinc finger, C2H2-like protein [Corchorus olitorius]